MPESPRRITGGRSVGSSRSLHTVEGLDGAGCGGGHTLESVASRYYTRTAGPPGHPHGAFGHLAPSARFRWVGLIRRSYARSHPIVELTHDIDHHRRHPKSRENNPEKGAVDSVVLFLRSTKQVYNGTPSFLQSSCNRRTTNIMSTVDLPGRNSYCDSGSKHSRSKYEPRRRATIFRRTLPACATREIPRLLPHSVGCSFCAV